MTIKEFIKSKKNIYIHCNTLEQLCMIMNYIDKKSTQKENKKYCSLCYRIFKDKVYITNKSEIGNIEHLKILYDTKIYEFEEIKF